MPWTRPHRFARHPGGAPEGDAPGRVVRAVLFSGVSTGLAVTGHHLASGRSVPWGAALPGAAVLLLAAPARPRGPVSLPGTAAATVAAQLLLHFWFGRADGPQAPAGHAAHTALPPPGALAAHGGDVLGRAGDHGVALSAAHGAAALLAAWLMQRADTAVRGAATAAGRRFADALGHLLVRLLTPGHTPAPPPAARRNRPGAERRPGPRAVALAHVLVRRGPPAGRNTTVRPEACTGTPALPTPTESTVSRTARSRSRARLSVRAACVAAATAAASLAMTTSALAHVEVEAANARALDQNVELSFSAETESSSAGITALEVVLPEGLKPADIAYKSGPAGWKLTPTDRGYTVSGPAVAVGEDAAYKVVVRQLPDAKSLAFKTLQTYGDGRVDRWIELEKSDGGGHGNAAPVLKLAAAAPGAASLAPATTPPTTRAPAPSATATATAEADGKAAADEKAAETDSGPGTVAVVVGVVLLVLVLAGAWLWTRRRGGADA
ncbi:DUF1775 domain-containing protein [Streptomyces termitum]|uniref:YncI copper-binding domain-containing protein n=1 Tax=Streptomyces termitum TaxID=67368 RepID=A0A918WDL2_9ACTN|nr:DUF1775 domain-containing protein [Streptomyces termitum]GHB07595.1 hypothetical protein GCM10010305_58450 [Streptomyces termitum]